MHYFCRRSYKKGLSRTKIERLRQEPNEHWNNRISNTCKQVGKVFWNKIKIAESRALETAPCIWFRLENKKEETCEQTDEGE